MKKAISKKLVLNKTTVTDLNSKEMTDIKGGLTYTDPRACFSEGTCSIYYTIDYTCIAGCPPCIPQRSIPCPPPMTID
ncbi:MAG TPA: class I lanthipeptide [Candidatus Deferrimicrobium sp.]|nr:class I lanthipeptide [Candidatus Kapabacteria bacterium]HLP58856.1 class I lanthipeptide [Candidatus Deferrimicrobium sp.]